MPRQPEVFVRELDPAEAQRLVKIARTARDRIRLRRAGIVLASVQGRSAAGAAAMFAATAIAGWEQAHHQVLELEYDFDTFISGHVSRLGNRADVEEGVEYVDDLVRYSREALEPVPMEYFERNMAGPYRGAFRAVEENYFAALVNHVTKRVLERTTSNGKLWEERLNGADVLTKHNVFAMLEKTRLERTHNGYLKRDGSPTSESSSSDNIRVHAATLNSLDLALPAGTTSPGGGLGVEGVGETADGALVYFTRIDPPHGSVAEAAPVNGAHLIPVPRYPPGLGLPTAAALGISGTAAWLALTTKGRPTPGETVLVLGTSSTSGRLATQLCRGLDAGTVIAASRGALAAEELAMLGADVGVRLEDLDRTLADVVRDGVDLVIDFVWGPAVGAALRMMKPGGRLVQVGDVAAADATIHAAPLRAKERKS